MEESWRGFRTLFTLEAKIASMDFGSLQKEFLGALPSGFEGVKRLASQKVKEIPLVDVQPSVNTQGRLLLWVFSKFTRFEMWVGQSCKSRCQIVLNYHMYTMFLCFHLSVGEWRKEKNKKKNLHKHPTWFKREMYCDQTSSNIVWWPNMLMLKLVAKRLKHVWSNTVSNSTRSTVLCFVTLFKINLNGSHTVHISLIIDMYLPRSCFNDCLIWIISMETNLWLHCILGSSE